MIDAHRLPDFIGAAPSARLRHEPQIVGGKLAALAILHQVELDLLALMQIAEPCPLNSADMNKGIIAAFVRSDEAKALAGVEPLDGSDSHEDSVFR